MARQEAKRPTENPWTAAGNPSKIMVKPKKTTSKTALEEFNALFKKKKKKKNNVKVPGVIDNNPIAHEESDMESEESDTENENPDYDIMLEPNKRQQEIKNIASRNKIGVEDDRSDRMSVYSSAEEI
jgi:hypothetical protein